MEISGIVCVAIDYGKYNELLPLCHQRYHVFLLLPLFRGGSDCIFSKYTLLELYFIELFYNSIGFPFSSYA